MHSIPDPSHVCFTGPLAPFATGLAAELESLGYARTTVTMKLGVAAHLSRWLSARHLAPQDLSDVVVEEFLATRRREYTSDHSVRSLVPILSYLRRVGVVPAASPPAAPTRPADVMVARFADYLVDQRALSVPVAKAYGHWVSPFVEFVTGAAGPGLAGLAASDVTRFLMSHLPALTSKQAQMTTTALRSFLRFAHVEGLVSADLAGAVPAYPVRKQTRVPLGLTNRQVEALFGACDRSCATGRRDFAVIICFARLGLRCAEVASLTLDDINWADGSLVIYGKGNRIDRLPLPVDVGEALAAYLCDGRPATADRALFVRAIAPFTAMGRSGVSCIVGRAARRAGLGTIHAHRLRHTAATRTLNAGASLGEIAHLMRHSHPNTTARYAKADLTRLAALTRAWPVETSGGMS